MSIEAMKQVLVFLEHLTTHSWTIQDQNKAIELQRQAIEQAQEPVAHDPLPRACNLAGVDYQTFLKIKAYMPVTPPQQKQEPVAWMNKYGACMTAVCKEVDETASEYTIPLYTSPPQRQWVGLTDEERKDLCRWWSSPMDAIYATEAKLKEKNT